MTICQDLILCHVFESLQSDIIKRFDMFQNVRIMVQNCTRSVAYSARPKRLLAEICYSARAGPLQQCTGQGLLSDGQMAG